MCCDRDLHVFRSKGRSHAVHDIERHEVHVEAVVAEHRRVLLHTRFHGIGRRTNRKVSVRRRVSSALAQCGVDRVELRVRATEVDHGEYNQKEERHDERELDDDRSPAGLAPETTADHGPLHTPSICGNHATNNAPPAKAMPYGKYRRRSTSGATAPSGAID